MKNSFKYFKTDTTTSKAPVTPTVTPETQLGRFLPCSRITTSSTGFPKAQWGAARNNKRELETSEREKGMTGTVNTKTRLACPHPYNLMMGFPKKNRENYSRECF